jgi:hypothetical protein
MATTELNVASSRARYESWWRAWARVYCATWLTTACSAIAVALVGDGVARTVRSTLALRLNGETSTARGLGHALALTAHNFPICAWPLLLGVLGADRSRAGRALTDAVLVVALIANTALAGAALGAYGSRLLPYLPQLPAEWAALALGASAWLVQRQRSIALGEAVALVGAIAVLLLCAAVLETFVVPHR